MSLGAAKGDGRDRPVRYRNAIDNNGAANPGFSGELAGKAANISCRHSGDFLGPFWREFFKMILKQLE